MTERYYIDTSIWIDLYEDRKGYNNEPLGEYALKLLFHIRSCKAKLAVSDRLIRELATFYSLPEVNGMIKPFEDIIEKIIATSQQREEAQKLADERHIPPGDALHAILARDNKMILVTRDRDFEKLKDISRYYKPEEIITL